jgi:hypothetical protein
VRIPHRVLRASLSFPTQEDDMTKTPTSKETRIQQKPNKSGSNELRDDDLQEVSGGLTIHNPTKPIPPVCLTNS